MFFARLFVPFWEERHNHIEQVDVEHNQTSAGAYPSCSKHQISIACMRDRRRR